MSSSSDIIDLTNSFTLADHCGLTNVIINLDTDDSLLTEANCSITSQCTHSGSASVKPSLKQYAVSKSETASKKRKIKRKKSLGQRKGVPPTPVGVESSKENFGGCPICWDDLGKNPLASTKCGHVYCMKCLQEYLKVEKRCPTCRQSLKGTAAYHPLYLSGS